MCINDRILSYYSIGVSNRIHKGTQLFLVFERHAPRICARVLDNHRIALHSNKTDGDLLSLRRFGAPACEAGLSP
ncbi:unnamed protein product [Penicillium salamii]|nr:unnamed protein product [Penicillium salamii]CAG8243554.1 unnamed protein product [Penicillium salamii]